MIVGGSGGIGAGCALFLGRRGAALGLLARDADRLREATTTLQRDGCEARAYLTDVKDGRSVEEAVADAAADLGGIDFVINAGPGGARGTPLEVDDAHWLDTLDSKVVGTVRIVRAALSHLIASEGGAIVNVAGTGGREPRVAASAVSAANAALVNLTKAMAFELAPLGIRVNAVSPGPIRTARHEVKVTALASEQGIRSDEADRRLAGDVPMGRIGLPSEVAAAIAFLIGPESSFITGANFIVDGGWTASAL